MPPAHRDLAFLLSLGSLPLACNDNKDVGDSQSGTTPSGTNPSGTNPSGTSPTEAGTMGDTDAGTATDSGSASVTNPTTTPTDPSGTTGGMEYPACQAYGDRFVECTPMYAPYIDDYINYCNAFINYGAMTDGPGCAALIEAWYVCLSMAPCDATDPCQAEYDQIYTGCPSFEPETTSGGDAGDSGTDP